jgi:hypothetical protein
MSRGCRCEIDGDPEEPAGDEEQTIEFEAEELVILVTHHETLTRTRRRHGELHTRAHQHSNTSLVLGVFCLRIACSVFHNSCYLTMQIPLYCDTLRRTTKSRGGSGIDKLCWVAFLVSRGLPRCVLCSFTRLFTGLGAAGWSLTKYPESAIADRNQLGLDMRGETLIIQNSHASLQK